MAGPTQQPPQQPQQVQVGTKGPIVLPSLPGIRRDGTVLDSDHFSDAQWCRFVRNRPRKMGGFVQVSPGLRGPVLGGFLFSRQFTNLFFAFSEHGVEFLDVDQQANGSVVMDITPPTFVSRPDILWSYDYLFDAAAGSEATLLIAAPLNTLLNIDDPTEVPIYTTTINNPSALEVVTDVNAKTSGGVFCTAPYTVLLGVDGNVTWSNANEPKNYATGDAGTARVTGSKLVKGLPMRTGVSSGGLLWSLDSVIRMDWVGGSSIFKFSHISTKSSIMSPRSVIEVDSKWYWLGVDRFMVSNGVQVEELPNEMNLNWLLDNLNWEMRQKVFAMKMPRFGEIWWFFPSGESEVCDKAVIYNMRSKVWYDTSIDRGFGFSPANFRYPLMLGASRNRLQTLVLNITSGTIVESSEILGTSSGATGFVVEVDGTKVKVVLATGRHFQKSEGFTAESATGSISSCNDLYSLFAHENGYDAVMGQQVTSIESYFTTCEFGAPTGGAQQNAVQGLEYHTRITRIEPDFNMEGEMTVQVLSRRFAQSQENGGNLYTFSAETGKIDLRDQAREFRLKFSSNRLGGFYEGGKTLVHLEPGDIRS